jgi:hypothetical protein
MEFMRSGFIIDTNRPVTNVVVDSSKLLRVLLNTDGVGEAVAVYMVEVCNLESFDAGNSFPEL